MAENDPTAEQSIFTIRDCMGGDLAPCLAWLPDGLIPYAIIFFTIIGVLILALGVWKKVVDLWRAITWGPRALWRWITGYEPPKSKAEKNTEKILKMMFAAQAKQAEKSGADLPQDTVERAVAAMREVLESNDPGKDDARKAFQKGDIQGAENALIAVYEGEDPAFKRIDDEALQFKGKHARTAREIAALAAVRSVEDALVWYQKAADLEPDDFSTRIELARLHQAHGNLDAAYKSTLAAQQAAKDDRDRSVALNEIGGVLVAQGDLPGALGSFRASMVIRKRLAEADASNAGLQRDLSVSHNKIGGVQVKQGDLPEALRSFRASHAIFERLAGADPSDAGLQRDLSVSHNKIGGVLVAQGDLP
ncbi:MAG TPA: hypothetical protein ENI72_00680, partial [Rhodospirillales bacterium]|nr:hypothetical protein [Rhodospirillales bacterium]